MTELLDQVLEQVKQLSEQEQDVIAQRISKQLEIKSLADSITVQAAQSLITNTKTIVKFLKLKDNVESKNDYKTPKEEKRFIGIQLVIDNTKHTKNADCAGVYFFIKDMDGNQYECSSSELVLEPKLASNDVDAGDITKGWIYTEIFKSVPVDQLRIRYEFGSKKSDWINLSEINAS
jgi:hypothetical protein